MTISKYSTIKTSTLFKSAQTMGELMSRPGFNKNNTSTTIKKMKDQNAEVRHELMTRLRAMDRNTLEFFPVNSHVVYTSEVMTAEQVDMVDIFDFSKKESVVRKNAKVIEYQGEFILIQCENETTYLLVTPQHLKLRFIRNND